MRLLFLITCTRLPFFHRELTLCFEHKKRESSASYLRSRCGAKELCQIKYKVCSLLIPVLPNLLVRLVTPGKSACVTVLASLWVSGVHFEAEGSPRVVGAQVLLKVLDHPTHGDKDL